MTMHGMSTNKPRRIKIPEDDRHVTKTTDTLQEDEEDIAFMCFSKRRPKCNTASFGTDEHKQVTEEEVHCMTTSTRNTKKKKFFAFLVDGVHAVNSSSVQNLCEYSNAKLACVNIPISVEKHMNVIVNVIFLLRAVVFVMCRPSSTIS